MLLIISHKTTFFIGHESIYLSMNVISHVEMSWFVSIVRDNMHETFSNFYHILHI